MKLNTPASYAAIQTHGGAPAFPHVSPINQLRRSVLSCLLWEEEYYEDGQSIADRIIAAAQSVTTEQLAALAIEARSVHQLRHVPLVLLAQLAKRGGRIVGDTIAATIQRPDELSEFLAVYWKSNGKKTLSKQVKVGLAKAFQKFNAYSLAKFDRDGAIKLRDVLFLVHAKPKDEEQAQTWKQLVENKLQPPDTWEVELSAGKDKKETFERLLREGKLGYLALLRNLRGMQAAGVDPGLMQSAILARKGAERVLPFRYVAAARACPAMEPPLDQALSEAISSMPVLPGNTAILVDVSGSMAATLSGKSDMTRMDAAAALASLIHGTLRVFTFSEQIIEVAPRRGMAGVDAIINSQQHGGTAMAEAIQAINAQVPHDRLIVITDEQATTGRIPDPVAKYAYMINVASYRHGIGYGRWTHLDGFSEGVLRWIPEFERSEA